MMHYPSTQPGHPTPEELDVLSQFAYRFSVPILIRTRDERNRVETSGGSGLAVLMGGRKRIVTAQHVVAGLPNAVSRRLGHALPLWKRDYRSGQTHRLGGRHV